MAAETTPQELLVRPETAWSNSGIVHKLRDRKEASLPLRVAFLDIDSTLSGKPEVAEQVRKKLDKEGFVTVFVSSRTEEMMMSRGEYEKSKALGLTRPVPRLLKGDDDRMHVAFADEVSLHEGLYDPDLILGETGTTLFLQQIGGGFKVDGDFEEKMGQSSGEWRRKTMEVLKRIDPTLENEFKLVEIDKPNTFEEGKVDVAPPDFRIQIQLNTTGPTKFLNTGNTEVLGAPKPEAQKVGLSRKEEFMKNFWELRSNPGVSNEVREQLKNIRVTDDSNPDRGSFSLYLTPNRGWKAQAVEYTIEQLQRELGGTRGDFETFFAGDSYPDVGMGLEGALRTRAEFLVVGGSRLTPVLHGDTTEFAGEGFGAIQRRIRPVDSNSDTGEYEFKTPLEGNTRKIILGDIKYPWAKGPETVLAYLNERYPESV